MSLGTYENAKKNYPNGINLPWMLDKIKWLLRQIYRLSADVESATSSFTGATALVDGTAGQVPIPVAGEETAYLTGDGTWTPFPAIPVAEVDFTGATALLDGAAGLVPAPAAGEEGFVLQGNGTWVGGALTDTNILESTISSSSNHLHTAEGNIDFLSNAANLWRWLFTTSAFTISDSEIVAAKQIGVEIASLSVRAPGSSVEATLESTTAAGTASIGARIGKIRAVTTQAIGERQANTYLNSVDSTGDQQFVDPPHISTGANLTVNDPLKIGSYHTLIGTPGTVSVSLDSTLLSDGYYFYIVKHSNDATVFNPSTNTGTFWDIDNTATAIAASTPVTLNTIGTYLVTLNGAGINVTGVDIVQISGTTEIQNDIRDVTGDYTTWLPNGLNIVSSNVTLLTSGTLLTAGAQFNVMIEADNKTCSATSGVFLYYYPKGDINRTLYTGTGSFKMPKGRYEFLRTAGNIYEVRKLEFGGNLSAYRRVDTTPAAYDIYDLSHEEIIMVGRNDATAVDLPFDLSGFDEVTSYTVKVVSDLVGACTISWTNASEDAHVIDLNGTETNPVGSATLVIGGVYKVIMNCVAGAKYLIITRLV